MCLVNRRGLGKAKHVDLQNLWIQEASESGQFATKKVNTSVNPAELMTKPDSKGEQLMSLMGDEFVSATTSASKGQATLTQGYLRQEGILVRKCPHRKTNPWLMTARRVHIQRGWKFCEVS